MSANEIHVGDIGTIFEVSVLDGTTVVDISTATVKQLLLRKPSGTLLTKAAVFKTTGTDGVLQYTTVSGDLNEKGVWSLQVYIELPTGKWHSDRQNFTVHENLS